MKRCFKCEAHKPLTEFYRHAQMGDGYLGKCKSCTKRDVAEHRLANIEEIREYDRARGKLPHRVELRRRVGTEYEINFPERVKAGCAVGNAVRDGKLIPWPTCALPECSKKPEAHHPDYGQPLQVVWLCSAHHKQAHALCRS